MSGVGFRIEEIWAFLAVHDDNDEGIVGVSAGGGWMVPAIAADVERLVQLRPHMRQIAWQNNQEIVLVKFDVRTNIETINPRRRPR